MTSMRQPPIRLLDHAKAALLHTTNRPKYSTCNKLLHHTSTDPFSQN